MSFSLYYSAQRDTCLEDNEKVAIDSIVRKYCSNYPFAKKLEDFCVYGVIEEEKIIFKGSTKLPSSRLEFKGEQIYQKSIEKSVTLYRGKIME